MLQVKTIIKESTIPNAGLGLFANQFIKKGDLIWQLNPSIDKIINKDILIHLSDIEKEYIDTYAYTYNNDIILCSDNGKYINHSKNPNTIDYIDKILGSITIAKNDINIGDEILSDYESFDDDYKTYSHLFIK